MDKKVENKTLAQEQLKRLSCCANIITLQIYKLIKIPPHNLFLTMHESLFFITYCLYSNTHLNSRIQAYKLSFLFLRVIFQWYGFLHYSEPAITRDVPRKNKYLKN